MGDGVITRYKPACYSATVLLKYRFMSQFPELHCNRCDTSMRLSSQLTARKGGGQMRG